MWSSGWYSPRREDRYRCFVAGGGAGGGCACCSTGCSAGTTATPPAAWARPLEKLSGVLPRGLFLLVLYGALLGLIQLLFYRRIPADEPGGADWDGDGEIPQKEF